MLAQMATHKFPTQPKPPPQPPKSPPHRQIDLAEHSEPKSTKVNSFTPQQTVPMYTNCTFHIHSSSHPLVPLVVQNPIPQNMPPYTAHANLPVVQEKGRESTTSEKLPPPTNNVPVPMPEEDDSYDSIPDSVLGQNPLSNLSPPACNPRFKQVRNPYKK